VTMNEEPSLPLDLPAPDPLPPVAWSGGVHDGSRIPESEKLVMRELYVTLKGSVHAVVKATGHTWKTVRAVCCPELAFKRVDPDTLVRVRELKAQGAKYLSIMEDTGLPRATIAAILAADGTLVETLQKNRAARMMVEEDMLMEERADAIEKRREAGKLSVSDLTNAVMVNGIIIKDAGGSAPTRIKHEADPSLVLAAQLFAGAFKPVTVTVPQGPVQEAELVPNKEANPEPVEIKET